MAVNSLPSQDPTTLVLHPLQVPSRLQGTRLALRQRAMIQPQLLGSSSLSLVATTLHRIHCWRCLPRLSREMS